MSSRFSQEGRLGALISVKVGDPDADFWVERRGSASKVGKPTREFGPERFGIKVVRTDVLLPNYLFYMIEYLWSRGLFKSLATGTTALVNIRASDITSIPVAPR